MIKHLFQSYADFSTQADQITILTVYAGGIEIVRRAMSQFGGYKYFKLGPVRIKLIPSSTLPVDPTQLSYEAGEDQVDPRDQLTPGLVRITNGEDLMTNLKDAGGNPLAGYKQRAIFNTMMLDTRWFKWNLQSGITKYAYPRYWLIGQVRQDYYPGATINVPQTSGDLSENYTSTGNVQFYARKDTDSSNNITYQLAPWVAGNHSSGRGLFQLGEHGNVGWLPTDASIMVGVSGDRDTGDTDKPFFTPNPNAVPQIELFRIILPAAFKTRYFYRMYVTETVYFKDPVIQNPEYWEYAKTGPQTTQWVKEIVSPLDRFIRVTTLDPQNPTQSIEPGTGTKPEIKNDASNKPGVIRKEPDPLHPDKPGPQEG